MDKLNKILADLTQSANISGLKAEFETEGASFEDIEKLKKLTIDFNLNLEVKIGGCGAVRDLIQCREICADIIVAPMIETEYSLQKFVTCVNEVYENINMPDLYINIETITGVNNLDNIFASKYFEQIKGVVLGRGDLALSLNSINADDEKIKEINKLVYQKTKKFNKKLLLGGKIKACEADYLFYFADAVETRKIVFENKVESCDIIKAIDFEIAWIESKNHKNKLDNVRVEELRNRLKIGNKYYAV